MKFILPIATCLLLTGIVFGQATPSFEAASVKLTPPNQPRVPGQSPVHFSADTTRVSVTSNPLGSLLTYALGVKAYQVTGPEWTGRVRVDIEAKPPEGATREQLPGMMAQLLRERFGLQFHKETQQREVIALGIGKDGLKLKELPADTPRSFKLSTLADGMQRVEIVDTMPGLANQLASYVSLSTPVLDQTGLNGIYAMTLDTLASEVRTALASGTADPSLAIASSPYKVVVERMGLTLLPKKVPVEIIVVDHLNQTPTAN